MLEKSYASFYAKPLLALTLLLISTLYCSATLLAQETGVAQETQTDILLPATARNRLPGLQTNSQVLLPNGWSLSPQGEQLPMGDFPANIIVSPDSRFAVVLHCGYGDHELRVVELSSNKTISTAIVDQAFYGVAFNSSGSQIAVGGGEDECVYVFPFRDGYLGKPESWTVNASEDFVASGLAFAKDETILVCGLLANELRVINAADGQVQQTVKFKDDSYPYAVCFDAERGLAYVSLWGLAEVAVVQLADGTVQGYFATKSHPTEMVLLDQGKTLLVACSNDNSVVVLDSESGRQREVIRTSLFPRANNGSTPASLCVSPDEKVLLAANADNNNLAVFDISERGRSKSLGFIPVGWYPTSVRFADQGQRILVANGKGLTSRSNVHGANPNTKPPATVREYIGGLFQGTLSMIETPSPDAMARMTRLAFAASPLQAESAVTKTAVSEDNPIPAKVGLPSPIKHCIYIIKENRTYDQVFGDLEQGNGDPSLCIFPRRVTPNHHALAEQFVLLDNFYVESEVSADGHEWTMAAYATDFVEKTWPLSYRGGRGKLKYPAEGKFKIAEPSSGYLWDRCREKDVSYFSFGEFVDNGPTPDDPCTTNLEALKGHFDPQFRSYDLDYTDIRRAERFIERFEQFLREDNLPQLMIVRLPNDHTYGTRVGKPTPTAMVADNDLALGMLVEAVSESPAWKETAIFVIQDDAQNGSDHVDAHRTVALAISPYTRKSGLDSTLYSTASMLRTMELILGLEPMTQFDAAAAPMYDSFHGQPDFSPFTALPAQVDLTATNDATAWGAELSEQLDLAKEDAADDLLFGDIVWRSVRGADSPMPAPVRSAFVFAEVEDEDDEAEEN